MSEMPNMESSADRVVAALHTVDEKVNAMRDQRLNDPDSFGDKIFKSVVPTLAGLVLGKAFEMAVKSLRKQCREIVPMRETDIELDYDRNGKPLTVSTPVESI